MTQYVLQIRDEDGWLAKDFEVSESCPIPDPAPAGRTQVVMTNTANFKEIDAAYYQYGKQLEFSYDEGAATVSCAGPVTKTWDIN